VAGTQVVRRRPGRRHQRRDIGFIKCDSDAHAGGVNAKATLTIIVGGKELPARARTWASWPSAPTAPHRQGRQSDLLGSGRHRRPTLMDFFSSIRYASGSDPYVDFFASNVRPADHRQRKDFADFWGNIKITDVK